MSAPAQAPAQGPAEYPDSTTQRNITSFTQANPLPFKADEQPRLVPFNKWWHKTIRLMPTYFVPPVLWVLALVRMLQINSFFSDTFESVVGGTAAVLAMPGGINDLYNVCMTLFEVGVETTTVLTTFHTLRCKSPSAAHVTEYVEEFFRLVTTCTTLMGQAIPNEMLRVMLMLGCPPKLRKALIKNPAVRTLDQTKRMLLVTAGPLAHNLAMIDNPVHNDPMVLDAATQGPRNNRGKGPLSAEEKQLRKARGNCVYCDKPGHIADNCPEIKARDAARAKFHANRPARFNNAEEAPAQPAGNA